MIRLHRNLCAGVVHILEDIFQNGRYADKAIEYAFKLNAKWGARDRAFVASNVYDIVRYYRLYETAVGVFHRDFWSILAAHLVNSGIDLPEWDAFEDIEKKSILQKIAELKTDRKLKESIPDWLDELGSKELGDKWETTLQFLNTEADLVIRANTLKIGRTELIEKLKSEGIETEPIGNYALKVKERANLFRTQSFKDGLMEVQDFSSQQVAEYLDVEPGMRVIDACAGAGGKTLHLAALMQNKGRVLSLDTEGWKLQELRKRAARAGASIVETRSIESSKTIKRLHGSADRLLLDVPCSGLGVLRRNPDAKWKLTPDFINEIRQTQASILQQYSALCKPGGKIVYATCSILPSENQEQVKAFLEKNPERYRLVKEKKILPQDEGFDGFYMAQIDVL